MFNNDRYKTAGVNRAIPFALQLFMWSCIDALPEERDYFQVFNLEAVGDMQRITHNSERPERKVEYLIPVIEKTVTAKVYAIDSVDYSTMLLAEEY